MVGALSVGPPGTGRYLADLMETKPDLSIVVDRLRKGQWDALAELTNKEDA